MWEEGRNREGMGERRSGPQRTPSWAGGPSRERERMGWWAGERTRELEQTASWASEPSREREQMGVVAGEPSTEPERMVSWLEPKPPAVTRDPLRLVPEPRECHESLKERAGILSSTKGGIVARSGRRFWRRARRGKGRGDIMLSLATGREFSGFDRCRVALVAVAASGHGALLALGANRAPWRRGSTARPGSLASPG